MARIIGGIGASHTPTIGFARDRHTRDDAVWGGVFAGFDPVASWIARKRPDALVFVYNDHVTSFFFDHYSAFALGIGEKYAVADEGGHPRDLPPVSGHPALARHIAGSLVADEFDMSFFQHKGLDHGCLSPLSMMLQYENGWPIPVIPLQIGVLQLPIPTARRCYKLGKALRRAIASYPEEIDVVLVATGGLSHQVHGARSGFNNTPWDDRFLELIENDPELLAAMSHAELGALGGYESIEVIMWLVMRGALSERVQRVHRSYYLPSMTAIATVVFESSTTEADSQEACIAQRAKIEEQSKGLEHLEGTHPFTLATSVTRYRLNHFLHELADPKFRERFLADPEKLFDENHLPEIERDMLRRRDWKALIEYGVIFFLLEKLGAVVGTSNLHIYAAMRGETLETFRKTRNAPGALYSVAGAKGSDEQFKDISHSVDAQPSDGPKMTS